MWLDRVAELRMNEVSPHSLQGLELGLAQLSEADRAMISVIPGTAGAALEAASAANVVIADPPRKGLDPELAAHLSEQPPERSLEGALGGRRALRAPRLLGAAARLGDVLEGLPLM